ncbi:MAG: ATP-binding cassette domain-containing protein [Pseudomonadota bacterium]
MRAEPQPVVRMRNITKRFGGVVALQNVDFEAYSGEVVAIVGDNGAGKSTLIKILTGVYQPTEGEIELDGAPFAMADHSDAIAAGIDAVYQNLALADHLTPAQNLFLGAELTRKFVGIDVLDNARMESEARDVLRDRLGVELRDMSVATESLSGGQRQAIAIARAVRHSDLRVLVMDEPTAALGPQETARTLGLIKTLRDQGLAVIVISHSLDDVFEIADRIHVQRRGRSTGVVRASEVSSEDVLALITGAKTAA